MNTKTIFLFAAIMSSVAITSTTHTEGLRCKDFRNPLALGITFGLVTEYLYRLREPKSDFSSRASLGSFIIEHKNLVENVLSLKIPATFGSIKNIMKQVWFFYYDEVVGQSEVLPLLKTTDSGKIVSITPASPHGLWNKVHTYLGPIKSVKKTLALIALIGILCKGDDNLIGKIESLIKTGDFSPFAE